MNLLRSACVAAVSLVMVAASAQAQGAASDLAGLWEARGRFGPDVAGRLVVDRPAGGWRASIAGRTAAVRVSHDSVAFDLPDGSGSYLGRFDAARSRIVGHWIQPRTVTDGFRYASPVVLESCGADCFSGTVAPRADELSFFLDIKRRADGRLGVLLRNPERNLARFIRVDHVEADGSTVRLLDARDTVITTGVLREDGVMTVYFPGRGGSYDFHRVPDDAFTWFYPRGRPGASYVYTPPPDRQDGWPVGTLEDAGISRDAISAFIRTLAGASTDSLGALRVHGVLIARHGRLVLEEYFHGENGDKQHETRSASKTVGTVLIGAAMQAGAPIGPTTSAYAVMRPGATGLDARKRALTLEHLLTMSSGFDCDDSGDRPGDESNITDQDENPDWYGMILDLDVIRDPGAQAVYCSINPHLAGGMLARATGRSLPDLMYELVAEPLGMRGYYVPITPSGDGYLGGGWRFRPRDFMKLGQLYLNGGTWHGRRVLSEEWVRASTAPRASIGSSRYGYLWWLREYPYAGRTVQAYYASGNGGQYVMVIPDLDLVIAFYGGNYNERAGGLAVSELIPRYILPAVMEP